MDQSRPTLGLPDDEKEKTFNQQLKELAATKPQMVEDFQKPMVREVPVQKFDTVSRQPIKSGGDFMADQVIRDSNRQGALQAMSGKAPVSDVLDYKALKQEFANKARQAARSGAGRRAMGVIPFAGTAYAAMSGDPAMAADQAAGDLPVVGQAYEALKSEDAGNRDEERQMLADRNAQVNYNNSPAHLARLQALKGFGK